jgi:two-component system, NarL family, response regulator LiaR
VNRTIIYYGIALALLVFLMKFLEYSYFLRDLSVEFYVTLVALLFTGLGIWMGLKITRKPALVVAAQHSGLVQPAKFDISKREYEVLQLIGQGLSNKEIAEKLFVSLNTIKTHTSSLFVKLDAKRRTQAIKRAKELGLLA